MEFTVSTCVRNVITLSKYTLKEILQSDVVVEKYITSWNINNRQTFTFLKHVRNDNTTAGNYNAQTC